MNPSSLGDTLNIVTDIPGYDLLEEVGRSGMSTVYRAIQNPLGREVVLKVMSRGLSIDPHFKERFRREGKIVAQLRHPNIITIYDMGVVGGCPFIAMEYVAGKTLKERIHAGLTFEQSIPIVKAVAHALKYAHQRGYLHRDIKPSNVLFREDGSPVVADFGIAKAIKGSTSLTQTGMSFGTAGYMSPEQIRGERLDARSDLYSLGVVFYQMLTGKWPDDVQSVFSVSLKHRFEPIPPLPEHLRALQPVLDGMLAKVAEQRFQDEDAFLSALDDALATIRETADTTFSPSLHRPATQGRWRGLWNTLSHIRIKPWLVGWGATAALVGVVTFLALKVLPQDPELAAPQTEVEHRRHDPQEREGRVAKRLGQTTTEHEPSDRVEPAGHNTYERYQPVLAIDPNHEQAQEGIDRITTRFEQRAQAAQHAGDFEQGIALIQEGLKVDPGSQTLITLKKDITAEQATARQREKVIRLLAHAEKQYERGHLIKPVAQSAYTYYQQVLTLDPTNAQAQGGVQRIADRLAKLAREKQTSGELVESLVLIAQGLAIEPEHAMLRSLSAQVRHRLAEGHPATHKDPGHQVKAPLRELVAAPATPAQAQERLAEGQRQRKEAEGTQRAEEARPAVRTLSTVFRDTLKDGSQGPEMVVVPAGHFIMGSPPSEEGSFTDEGPQHKVTLASTFALGRYEVTVGEFRRFVADTNYRTDAEQGDSCHVWSGGQWESKKGMNWQTPGFRQTERHPVVCVSWNDAVAYTKWLSKQTGKPYRLPSEVEWEYSARAGTLTARYWGDPSAGACGYANVADQTTNDTLAGFTAHNCTDGHVQTAPVGTFKANHFGLHDTLGNVWEWTADCWNNDYVGAPKVRSAWLSGDCNRRVLRGGSWGTKPSYVRSASRYRLTAADRDDFLGFRIARNL